MPSPKAVAVDAAQTFAGRLKYRLRQPPWPAPIFVIGTGRSGTNWVGEILDGHPDIAASIERPRFFKPSTQMALDPSTRSTKFRPLVRLYKYEIARVAPRHFADKSHADIWIADLLAAALPGAIFIGVHRDVYGTTASFLRHRGVMYWSEHWREYPLPNAFLGIGADEADWYETLTLAGRSALRWVAHENRFAELRPILGQRLVEVHYEDLQLHPSEALRAIEQAVGLETPIPEPSANRSSLERWRKELSAEQIAEIDQVVAAKKLGP